MTQRLYFMRKLVLCNLVTRRNFVEMLNNLRKKKEMITCTNISRIPGKSAHDTMIILNL